MSTLVLLWLAIAAPALGAAKTTSDMADGSAVAQIAHEDAGGVLRYTVTAFDTIRTSDVQLMRWDLDLDGDGAVTGRNDACVVLRPVKGRRLLRADLYRGCTGDPVASSDGRPKGNTLTVRLLLEELREAGLSDDETGYAYRFRAVAKDGSSDEVPDTPSELITHTLGASGSSTQDASEATGGQGSSEDAVVGDASATVDGEEASDTAATAAKQGKKDGDKKDTMSTGTAEDEVVTPGDDVGIHGSGFARNQPLEISLAGAHAATSTATQSPSPSPSPSASPTSTPAGTQSVSAQDVNGADAGATQIGVAMSDDEGNLDEEVDIPEETNAGDYTIRAVGRNATGGTHTVTIPIKVAAGVEDGSSGGATAGQVTNATGTATQAPTAAPVSTTGTTTLPTTGSSRLPLLAGLGTIGVVLGGSMVFARRRVGTAGVAGATPMPPRHSGSPAAVFDFSGLRGEMQRLLALRAHRHDPDRDADL